jgi:hypothetical protein
MWYNGGIKSEVKMKTVTPRQRAQMAQRLVSYAIEVFSPEFFDAYEALTGSKSYPLSAETFSGIMFDTVLEPAVDLSGHGPTQYSKPERERVAQMALQLWLAQ